MANPARRTAYIMSRRSRKNVGLIGLGIIGHRVAENLRRNGFHVFVWNRTPRPVPNFVGSVAELAELCPVIQIFVADDEALREIIQLLTPALGAHHIVLVHSTVSPESMRSAAEAVQRRGARFLDAPFTGSKEAAEKGQLVYYVAGDDGALREARPVLEASSKEIVEFDQVGEATLLKVATNMVTAATVQSAAEALALVVRQGMTPAKFERALRSNASQSGTLAMKLPKIMRGDFETHFSLKHMLKDMQIAGRLAQASALDLRVTEAARDVQLDEVKYGHAEEDYSCVARKYFPEGIPPGMMEPQSLSSPEPQLLPAQTILPNAGEAAAVPESSRDSLPAETDPSLEQHGIDAPVPEELKTPRSFFNKLFRRGANR